MDIDSIEEAARALRGEVNLSFGWGTNLTNDFKDCAPAGVDGELAAMSNPAVAATVSASPPSTRSAMPRVAKDPVASSRREASPSPARRRKFASRCGPSGVSTDSGWNWTPSMGRVRWRRPMTTPSSGLVAVT